MKQTWRKLGCLYAPSGVRHEKLLSHAANPLPIRLDGHVFRVFYSARDRWNRSSVGAVDIDLRSLKVVYDHPAPFFQHGDSNSFLSHGVSIANCYTVGEQQYMLFMGWQSPPDGHWRGDIGRLRVSPDLSLSLDSDTPLLGASETDPISLSYPWVMASEEGGYDMWYGSTLSWESRNGEMVHVIQHASSIDGHQWQRRGLSVPYRLGIAQAFSRPTVLKLGTGEYRMWFSYRGTPDRTYRIGSAVKREGQGWILDLDQVGIDVSTAGWDSEMIEYPYVFEYLGDRFMLYNGNRYGATGFGIAVQTNA